MPTYRNNYIPELGTSVWDTITSALQVATINLKARKTNELADKTNADIDRSLNINLAQLQSQTDQSQAATRQKQSAMAGQARAELARIATISGESGVGGATANRLTTATRLAEGDAIGTLAENQLNADIQNAWQGESLRIGAEANKVEHLDKGLTDLQIAGVMMPLLSKAPDPAYGQHILTSMAGNVENIMNKGIPGDDFYGQLLNGALGRSGPMIPTPAPRYSPWGTY